MREFDSFFSLNRLIQANPRNPIMSEKSLMSAFTPRAPPSFHSFLRLIVDISCSSVSPINASAEQKHSAPRGASTLINERPIDGYSTSRSWMTAERKEWQMGVFRASWRPRQSGRSGVVSLRCFNSYRSRKFHFQTGFLINDMNIFDIRRRPLWVS